MHAGNCSSSELAAALAALLRLLRPPSGSGLLEMLDEANLSPSQLKALLTLTAEPTPLPVKALAERVGISEAAMSRAVDGLARRELVSRTRDVHDRRARTVSATDAGEELASRMEDIRHGRLEAFARDLDAADRDRLMQAIQPVLEHARGTDG